MRHSVNAERNGSAGPAQPEEHTRKPLLLQRRLLVSVTVPAAIGLVQLALAIVAVIHGDAPVAVLLWTLPALVAGYGFGRMTGIAWNSASAQVSLIRVQLLLTFAYIVTRLGAHVAIARLLGDRVWVADILLLVSFGLFFGRSIGLAVDIQRALVSRDDADPAVNRPS